MGTTAEKLTYLNETKTQLKIAINYGLETPLTNEPFREYVSSIKEAFLEALRTPDTLFTNLPKITGSGSNISLTGVANAPMRIELGASELTQASTPTPSSPQDIHTISGNNTILVRGKNLFDGIMEEGAYDNSNGNKTTNSTMRRNVNIIPVEPSTTYKISNNGTGVAMNVMQYRKNKTFISASVPSATSSFTTTENTCYINIYRGSTNVDKLQIEKGSTATTYEPYISQEAEIDLGYENKLVYPYNNNNAVYTNNGITYTQLGDGRIKINGTSTSTSSFLLRQSNASIPSGDYTAKLFNGILNDCYLVIGGSNSSTTYSASIFRNFSVSNNDCGHFMIQIPSGKTFNNLIVSPMLVKGTYNDIPSFTPYGGKIQYCKIGNYEDKFIRTSGKNLFDLTKSQTQSSNTPKVQDDKIVASSPTTWSSIYFTFTGLSKNTTYYIKSKLAFTSGGGAYSQIFGGSALDQSKAIKTYLNNITTSGDYSTSFSTGDNDTITISFCTSGNSGIWTLSNIILSTEDIPYEPYGSNEWYIKKNIGKIVLDGTESWNLDTTKTITQVFQKTTKIDDKSIDNTFLCNYFISQAGDTEKVGFGNTGSQFLYLAINKTTASTVAELQTWLSTHNTNVYYILATPTYTQITGTLETQLENVYQKLLSQTGTTNISQVNNDLPFIMNVQAIEV